MIPWLLIGGVVALWLMSGPKRIDPPPGSRWSIDLTATNITPEQLRADLTASTAAKGNKLLSFVQTAPHTYQIVVEYGQEPSTIWVERPIHTQGGVVLTALDAVKQ